MFKPVNQIKAYKQVEEQIKKSILNGVYKPGDKLPSELDMADTFNVSRSTIREAIRALEQSGLLFVERGPGKGAKVCNFSPDIIADNLSILIQMNKIPVQSIIEARIALEGTSARLAAERATVNQLKEIERALAIPSSEVKSSLIFHLAVAKASQNDILIFLILSLRQVLLSGFKTILSQPDTLEVKAKEHFEIFEAIKNRDTEKAYISMSNHIISFKELIGTDAVYIPGD